MSVTTLTIDADRVSPSRSLAILARSPASTGGALICVTGRMFGELERELGGPEAVARHLFEIATATGRPLCVNLPSGTDTSRTIFISPRGWSEDRLAGWAAGRHAELEGAFGPASVVRGEAS